MVLAFKMRAEEKHHEGLEANSNEVSEMLGVSAERLLMTKHTDS